MFVRGLLFFMFVWFLIWSSSQTIPLNGYDGYVGKPPLIGQSCEVTTSGGSLLAGYDCYERSGFWTLELCDGRVCRTELSPTISGHNLTCDVFQRTPTVALYYLKSNLDDARQVAQRWTSARRKVVTDLPICEDLN